MPLARGSWEQIEGSRFVAEIEAGGMVGQRNFEHRRLNATSFEDIMAAMAEFYYRQVPPKMPKAGEEEKAAEGDRDALRAEAEALGLDVDNRWGAKRLRDEIAKRQVEVAAQESGDERS